MYIYKLVCYSNLSCPIYLNVLYLYCKIIQYNYKLLTFNTLSLF